MKRRSIYAFIALFLVIPFGFFSKFYKGREADWLNNSLCGVFYEIFWCLVLFLIFRKLKPVTIALIVFFTTSLLEFTQLWKPVFLEVLRSNFFVRTVIGNSFAWTDFIYYIIGSFAGLGVIMLIGRITQE